MKNKKFILFIPHLEPGGAERVTSQLLNYAVKSGYEAHVVLISHNAIFYELNESINVHRPSFYKGKKKFIYYFKTIFFVRSTLKNLNAESLFVMGYRIIPALATIGLNIRLVGSFRTSPYREWTPLNGNFMFNFIFSFLYHKINKIANKRYDGMIMQTKEAVDIKRKEYRSNCEFEVIPNFVRKIKKHKVQKKNQIICVGRLSKEKGQIHLLEAFAKLQNAGWNLLLVGDGSEKTKLEMRAVELGIKDKVDLPGFHSEVDYYLQQSEIYVLPSLIEGFPNALQEAMGNGLACISFDCKTGPSELIINGENGILIPLGDERRLTQELNRLIYNDELRAKLGNNAKSVKKDYNISRLGKKYLQFIFSS